MLRAMDAKPELKPEPVAAVIERLSKVETSSAEIARKLDVSESWLKQFRRGKIPNPGILHFRKVVAYLDSVNA
jgi:predicted transcriptional regulator